MGNGSLPTPTDEATIPLKVEHSKQSSPTEQEALLFNENEQLRQELASFKQQFASLQRTMRQQQGVSHQPLKAKTSGGVNKNGIEMSPTVANNSHKRKPPSESSEKEALDMESGTNLEYHGSIQGLHHRNRLSQTMNHELVPLQPPARIIGPLLSTSPNDDDDDDDEILLESNSLEEETFFRAVTDRAGWLVGLLVLQSMSSFIIARNESLLQQHGVIVQFLTMLVGAGGNAGNQASVRVIRGLAVGSIDHNNMESFLKRELLMGLCLSIILAVAGFGRALVFFTPWPETFAITTSLFIIVGCSVVIGSLLPLGMRSMGIDPAHSRYVHAHALAQTQIWKPIPVDFAFSSVFQYLNSSHHGHSGSVNHCPNEQLDSRYDIC
eukprot:scaffold22664_cov125-Cylindrotheca_fusiformis.AAC.7